MYSTKSTDMNLNKLRETLKDRGAWCAAVQGKSIKNEIIREAMRIHSKRGGAVHIDPPKKSRDGSGGSPQSQHNYSHRTNKVSAVAVTRLFRSLATLFQDKIGGGGEKNLPVIDRRQKREIEEKRNAEMSFT